jgi:hypothetical protein
MEKLKRLSYKEEKSLQRNGNRKRMSTKKEVSKREGLNIN